MVIETALLETIEMSATKKKRTKKKRTKKNPVPELYKAIESMSDAGLLRQVKDLVKFRMVAKMLDDTVPHEAKTIGTLSETELMIRLKERRTLMQEKRKAAKKRS
jgi:hypothetical protein